MTSSDGQTTDRRRPTMREPITRETAVEARQGVISGRVVTVLLISTLLSVAALALAWLIFGH